MAVQIIGAQEVVIHRVILSLGLLAGASVLAVVASCRSASTLLSFIGLKKVAESRAYRTFCRPHSSYWAVFGVAVVAHLLMAVSHTGLWPASGDPDARTHQMILLLALATALSVLSVVSSCRIFPGLMIRVVSKSPLANRRFKSFYGLHSLLLLLFLGVAAAHATEGVLHAGLF